MASSSESHAIPYHTIPRDRSYPGGAPEVEISLDKPYLPFSTYWVRIALCTLVIVRQSEDNTVVLNAHVARTNVSTVFTTYEYNEQVHLDYASVLYIAREISISVVA